MLPKIQHPTYVITIPSLNISKTFRPMLVKEERILLMAKESKEEKDIYAAIKQVIVNCVQDTAFNISQLAEFDLEWIFLQLRLFSIADVIEQEYIDHDDEKSYKLSIDLKSVLPPVPTNDKNLPLPDGSAILMRYPSADLYGVETSDEDFLFGCCDAVIAADGSITKIDDKKEFLEWYESLPISVSTEIDKFFSSIPSMKLDLHYTNSKGTERTIQLRTLSDFFILR